MTPLRYATRVFSFFSAALAVLFLFGCLQTQQRIQGHVISDNALQQVRPGVSRQLVEFVMGSPQSKNSFGTEDAYYYIQTRIDQSAFGLKSIRERKVVAVYFDTNDRVVDKAVYTLEDGRIVTTVSRVTPGFDNDRSFVQQLLNSLAF